MPRDYGNQNVFYNIDLFEAAGVPYELVHAVVGREPADHVVEVAEKAHASLLVIGLRRRTSVGKFLMGSSASMILMQAPCPVLAVKAHGGEHR